MDPMQMCPGKGLVLPNLNIDKISSHSRFLILSLPNNGMFPLSPFAILKAIQGIGGEPKSIKKLRSGDLLIETISSLQTKSFLLAKMFLDSHLTVSPHSSLNTSRGVISEPDLLITPEAEILDGFSNLGVIQIDRYIAIVAKRNRRVTSTCVTSMVTASIGKTISAATVRRRLHMSGLYARVPRVCVRLSVQLRGT
ncbi:uncharacterized protein TNCV_3390841 [Trichonephila clavipes]|nr:uncharacterized protein TNCV_3390841 [Trichonephila clavipes]